MRRELGREAAERYPSPRAAARDAIAEFDYQLDADEKPLAVKRFALDPGRIFVTSPVDRCDFTLAAVRPGSNGLSITSFGWLPVDDRTDKALEGEPIVII